MKKYSFLIICTLLTGLLFTTCEPWIVPEAVFVNFNANGGQGDMKAQRFMDGEKQSLTKNTYTRNGYIFDGWNTSSDGRGQSYTDRQNVSITKSVTLYAQWELVSDNKGHDYVDLGLPSGIKWATCNVGATTPEGYGLYFAWGEISPKGNYDWNSYRYCNGSNSTMTKYCTQSDYGYKHFTDDKTTLDLSDDAARAIWGGKWRMPTQAEQEELINNCTWTWTTQDGVSGYKVASKTNGNSIFLPAAGYRYGTSVSGVGSLGYYWSSSLSESFTNCAYDLYFDSGYNVDWRSYDRSIGLTVRAVCGNNTAAQTFTLTFNANGGTGTMAAQTFEAGVSQAIKANTFTRSGYTFTGWNTNADGSGTAYTDKQSITLSQNITLYAQWKKVAYGNVEYAQVDVNAAGIVDGGTALSAGTVLAQSANVTMTVGADDTYRTATAAANDMTKVRIGSSVLDLAVACQGSANPKDASVGNCDANATVPASGAFFAFDVKKDGYLYVVIKASSNKTYLVGEEGYLIGYQFAAHMPGQAWGDILAYTLQGEGEFNIVTDPALLIWSEKIALGEAWETAAGEAGKIADSGVAVIKFPVFAGCRYTVNGCGTKIIASGYFFGTSEETVVLDDGYGNEVVLYETGVSNTNYYNVTFNANGGTGTMAAQTFESGVSQAIAANAFTRSGYTFTGWNTNADGRGTSYTDKQSITLSQDITLYAQWEQEQEQVVSGTENGHDYVDLGLPSGLKWATCNVGATTPDGYGDYFAWGETRPKDNYDWTTYKYCNGSPSSLTKYNTKSILGTVDNKIKLDLIDDAVRVNWGGKWRMPTKAEQDELDTNCTITWTTQNGVSGYNVTSKINGKSIFLPAAGYRNGTSVVDIGDKCLYWPSSLYETNPACAYFSSIKSSSYGSRSVGRTVRAVFSDNDKPSTFVTLTFNANGGSGTMAAQAFEPGVSQAIVANTFTRDGYIFTGWNTKADGSGTSYTDKQSITISQNITLYAQWIQQSAVEFYVSYEANGGYGEMEMQVFKYGEKKSLLPCAFVAPSGFVFNGWNTKEDGTGTAYSDQQEIVIYQDLTLYAQWKKGIYTVTFDANGGSGTMAAQTFEGGVSQALSTNVFTRDGFLFDGWNTKADGNGTSYRDKQIISVSKDLTLYAQWKKGIYTVTFDANGGSGTMAAQTFKAGVSQAIAANAFTRSGYTFTGWNTNADGSGTSYTDKQSITLSQDITLYAQWFMHTYVDLGLSVKWATCNVGATSPEGYGDYFAWGETEPKTNYDESTYKYCNGSETTLTKYNTKSDHGIVDNKTTLELSDDAARANWGGTWRMPTEAEQNELRKNCTWTWTTQNGVNGYKVTSKINGNNIFLPAAGHRYGTSVRGVGSYGEYWSSSLIVSSPNYVHCDLCFDSAGVYWSSCYRGWGFTVRAVCP